MAKGYWIARVDVTDPEAYKNYVANTPAAIDKFGGRFLARGGRAHQLEGAMRSRNVIIEFESFEQAVACYNSPEYQLARAHRLGAAEAEFMVVEGVD